MKRVDTREHDGEDAQQQIIPQKIRLSLHEPHKIKRLHLIRHGEALHNKLSKEKGSVVHLDPVLVDPSLTSTGVSQAKSLQGKLKGTELLIVSPLERTIETALHIFDAFEDHSRLPFTLALDQIREVSGKHYPDKRHPISLKKPKFPTIDFSQILEDDDKLWITEHREPPSSVNSRVSEFLEFLWTRPEQTITVVSHFGILECIFVLLTGSGRKFDNCEVREVVLVNHQ